MAGDAWRPPVIREVFAVARSRSFCKWIVRSFAVLYLLAVMLFLIGTFGLFGQDRDPLAGVFLLPLGIPWVWLVDLAPTAAWPWLSALAPLLNIGTLIVLCRKAQI